MRLRLINCAGWKKVDSGLKMFIKHLYGSGRWKARTTKKLMQVKLLRKGWVVNVLLIVVLTNCGLTTLACRV